MGIVTFTTVVTLLALSVSLAITVALAVPFVWLTVVSSAWLGRVERSRAAALLGVEVASPHAPLPDGMGWLRRLQRRATAASTWREIGYHALLLPVGTVTFSLAVAAVSVPVLMLLLPVLQPFAPRDDLGTLPLGLAVALAGALVLALLTPVIVGHLARFDAWLVRSMLGPAKGAELTARVEQVERSRTALVDAVDAERRRIERDLHDGAQQRLVAVAMDLGMAKAKLDEQSGVTPEVRALVESAHNEARRAITELRDVARGVHPAILEDRGLDAALSSLAARCPVPVRIDVDLPERPPRAAEAVAYYVVAEALTNVAKHAQATQVTVRVSGRAGRLGIEVTDDGRGGAVVGAPGGLGGGLAGLRDRVASVDGWFQVLSPVGGPTTILVELPCAS